MSEETPTQEEAMPEEPSALSILQKQIEHLTSQLTELREHHAEALKMLDERDAKITAIEAKPEASARIAELEASIRDRNHFDKFAELAKGAKAKDAALKHLWQVGGYKAEAGEIDEKALQSLVARLKTEAGYAFDPADSGELRVTTGEKRETSRTKYGLEMRGEEPAGGGRSSRNQGADGTIVTQEMRADPKFMLDPKNREIIRDAALGGRFR
ncbi:MAG: hypothetical protein ACLQU5_01870 [Isosphaeraceae bacterium]